jgi:hypothetical protein
MMHNSVFSVTHIEKEEDTIMSPTKLQQNCVSQRRPLSIETLTLQRNMILQLAVHPAC